MALTLRRFASVSGLTFLSRLTGFINVVAMGQVLGLSREADAFMVANVLPNIIYEMLLGGLIASVFVPMFSRRRVGRSQEEWREESAALCSTMTLWLLLLTAAASLLAPWAVQAMTLKTPDPEVRSIASVYFRIFALQIVFYGISSLAGALLNAEGRFSLAAFAPVLNNVVVTLTLGAYAVAPEAIRRPVLAVGVTAGVGAMALVQLWGLARVGWPGLRLHKAKLWHPLLREAARLGLPMVLLILVQQFALTVRSNLASSVEGGFTAIQHTFRFFQLPYGLLAVTITTLAMPGLAGLAARGDAEGLRKAATRAFRWTVIAILPFSLVYAALSGWLMRLVMSGGLMGIKGGALLGDLLFYYALAVFPFSMTMLASRLFYAWGDTRTPVILLTAINLFSVGACIVLFDQAGLEGMSMGILISYGVGAIAGLWLVFRKLSLWVTQTTSGPEALAIDGDASLSSGS